MKGLAEGLITNALAAYTWMTQFENVLPIRGIQKMDELEQCLSFMQNSPKYTEEINSFVEKDRK